MIEINETDDIKRYFADFRARISFLNDNNNHAFKCCKLTKNEVLNNKSLFGLSDNDKEVEKVIAQVDALLNKKG